MRPYRLLTPSAEGLHSHHSNHIDTQIYKNQKENLRNQKKFFSIFLLTFNYFTNFRSTECQYSYLEIWPWLHTTTSQRHKKKFSPPLFDGNYIKGITQLGARVKKTSILLFQIFSLKCKLDLKKKISKTSKLPTVPNHHKQLPYFLGITPHRV